jgi:integrase
VTPSTNAGGTPAPELHTGYDTRLHARGRGVRELFSKVTGADGRRRGARVSAVHDAREEAGAWHSGLRMGALRFLYKKTLRRHDIDIEDLPLVKASKTLPVALNPDEVTRLIEGAANLWHRTILMLLHATGLP